MSPVDCPNCHDISNVRKVADIYEEGTLQQKSRWTRFFVSGSHTSLAEKLAPPREPEYPRIEGAMVVFAVILFLVMINEIRNPGMLLTAIGIGIFAAALIVYQIYRYKKLGAAYVEDIPKWERAMMRWKNTCYCKNCDLVFDPVSLKQSPASAINHFVGE